MTRLVEETRDDIEHATEFVDVRDLLVAWRERAGADMPMLAPFLEGPAAEFAPRTMLLTLDGERLVYDRVGAAVVAVIGHDPTGKSLDDIDNPTVKAFRPRYLDAIRSKRPLFALQHQIGPGAMGANERLILPLRDGDATRHLLVYLRAREDAADILRSVFNASTDGITVMKAMRGEAGRIADFVVIAINAEAARRLGGQPDGFAGRTLRDIWPFAEELGLLGRFADAVEAGRAEVFDTRYPQRGIVVERRLRLAPHGDTLTVTNIDLGPILAATRAVEKQRNELYTANALLECRALDLKASNDALERTTQELRAEIERNHALEAELTHLAHHDGLTGLPNRHFFDRQFGEVLDAARQSRRQMALCLLDVDHFKEINDRFGHSTGDAVLRAVAERLRRTLRKSDIVGRLGGDEFAVLLTDARDIDDVRSAVRRMIEAVTRPLTVVRQDVPISLSVGVAVFPTDAGSEHDLTAAADIAVYQAKRAGRGRPVFFAQSMREEQERHGRLIVKLRRAVERGEIHPFYQPLMDLRTGQLIGFEALARWRDGDRILTPAAFADAFEEPEIAQALTRTMLDGVLADLRDWSGKDIPAHVSVNVTAFDLRRPDFPSAVMKRLAAYGLSSRQLAVEVTETTVLSHDAERIGQTLAELRQLGFSVSLDDFGTGYASLSHLLKLPVDSLKIDRSFVADIERNPKTMAIVRSVVALAAALHLDVVAEGVETRAQLDTLRGLGCHLVQGFLIAEPMPAADVPGFIAAFGPRQGLRPPRLTAV